MIDKDDNLTWAHPLSGETLCQYIDRVIVGHQRWPLSQAETAVGAGPLFEPSYVFAPCSPAPVIKL